MKAKMIVLLVAIAGLATSCVTVVEDVHYGRRGFDGEAFFGIDYVYEPPFAYWDENPSIPDNPRLGEYYYSYGGTYYFEYYINPDEYWYGDYTLFIERGGPGLPYGEPGYNGRDTYLMMVFDRDFGPREYRKSDGTVLPYQVKELDKGEFEITPKDGSGSWKIVAKKARVADRPSMKK